MPRTTLFLCLGIFLGSCDANTNAPELSIEVLSPSSQQVIERGASFHLNLEITSALDLRLADLGIDQSIQGEITKLVEENIRIRQGAALTKFFIDTTLTMPAVTIDPDKTYNLLLIHPAGTSNILKLIPVRIE